MFKDLDPSKLGTQTAATSHDSPADPIFWTFFLSVVSCVGCFRIYKYQQFQERRLASHNGMRDPPLRKSAVEIWRTLKFPFDSTSRARDPIHRRSGEEATEAAPAMGEARHRQWRSREGRGHVAYICSRVIRWEYLGSLLSKRIGA